MFVFTKIKIKVLIFLLIFGFGLPATAKFELTEVEAIADAGLLQVDARADLSLSSKTRQALESGVDLRIKFVVELMQPRYLIWDTSIKHWQMLFTLHFHQLSSQYILAIPQSDSTQAFNTIDSALEQLASKLTFNLGYEQILERDEGYYVRMKIVLDSEFLPAPLKLLSLISSDWDLDSGWKKWPLKP